MIHPNEHPPHPEWSYPRACACQCRCATLAAQQDRECGCCPTGCITCTHDQPLRWEGDDS